MAWKEIKTDADIEELMQTCLGFHDSCVVSATYVSVSSISRGDLALPLPGIEAGDRLE